MTAQTFPASTTDLIPSAPEGRFDGVRRPYSAEDVARLRGSVQIQHTLAERGAQRLWQLLHERPYVHSLGAMTGNQAMQMARAGLEAIYLSGWAGGGGFERRRCHASLPVALSGQFRP